MSRLRLDFLAALILALFLSPFMPARAQISDAARHALSRAAEVEREDASEKIRHHLGLYIGLSAAFLSYDGGDIKGEGDDDGVLAFLPEGGEATGIQTMVGYEFNERWASEMSFVSYEEQTVQGELTTPDMPFLGIFLRPGLDAEPRRLGVETSLTTVSLLRRKAPVPAADADADGLWSRTLPFAKFGIARLEKTVTDKEDISETPLQVKQDWLAAVLGVGVDLPLNDSTRLRVLYEYIATGNDEGGAAHGLTLSCWFRF